MNVINQPTKRSIGTVIEVHCEKMPGLLVDGINRVVNDRVVSVPFVLSVLKKPSLG